jgi:hypothetical protein
MSVYHVPGFIHSRQCSLKEPLQQILRSKPVIWVLNNTAHSRTLTQTTIPIIIIIIIIINKNNLIGNCKQTTESANVNVRLFVFLALQTIVVVFSQPGSGL